jgi:two-component system phosphate regulon sensor histidine kinase PhoR
MAKYSGAPGFRRSLQGRRGLEDESRLTSVLENMIDGVIMIDREAKLVLVNRAAEQIAGFSASGLLGQHVFALQSLCDLHPLIERCMAGHERIRDEIALHLPEERIVEVNLIPIVLANGVGGGTLIILHDTTSIRRLERIRSEFVANVSHELKTPIASVKGFSETLLAGAMDDPETAKTFLQIIYDESERINRLIGDLLELSKIESRLVPLRLAPVDLHELIGKTVEAMGNQAENKHIALSMAVDRDLYIEADEDRLRQILINLLSNGVSYTPEGGKVSVKAFPVGGGQEEEKMRIVVSDTGIGIPKEDLTRIFERFYKVDKARSRSSGGTGLGLSIVKHLVDLHGGTIHVDSVVGVETTFTIELPILQK